MKLNAYSHSRSNAGAAAKRAYGSSTATIFVVFDEHAPRDARSLYVVAYGATPGERKTNAMRAALPYFEGKIAWPARNDDVFGRVKAYPIVTTEAPTST